MSFFESVLSLVAKVPKGSVATYGQIAALCGHPRGARMVGWALHNMSEDKLKHIPWQRVINREGRISTACIDHTAQIQAVLLKKDGVKVEYKDGSYFVDLKRCLWKT